jgi:ABC-type multidrug transport system fused ATPase/permease subunit
MTKKVLSNCKKEFIMKFITSLLARGSLLVLPILYGFAVDGISNSNFKIAYTMIIVSILITLIYRLSEHMNQVTYYNLYNKLYQTLTKISLSYTHRNSIYSLSRINLGEYTNIFNNDVDVISAFWATSVVRVVYILEFLFIYFYFFKIDLYIGLATVVISIIALLIVFKYGTKIETLNKNRKDTLDKQTGIIQEMFLGIKEIKGLNLTSSINKRVHNSTNDYLAANAKYNVNYNKNKFISLFFVEISRLLLFLYGIYLISMGRMEIGVLLIIYNYYANLINNINEIGTINMEYRNLLTSWLRFNKLIEYSRNDNKVLNQLDDNLLGRIVFDNVLYGNREKPHLKDVSFTIEPNSITVITGKGGNDKVGIFDLLLRLNRQHTGKVMIDDIDIQVYSDDAYYNLVSSVREQPTFFNLSIKENLEVIEHDFAKIVDVCRTLNIHDNIMNLSDGYDTILTTSADNVDATTKNLLTFARVLLKDTKIMLFYDVMGVFDATTLTNIFNIMKGKKSNHTLVIIGHTKELLEMADKIIIIEDGEVMGEGSLEQLKNNPTIKPLIQ